MPITEAFKQKLMKAIKSVHDDQTIEVKVKIEVVDAGRCGVSWFFIKIKPRPAQFRVSIVDLEGTEVIPITHHSLSLTVGDSINIAELRSAFEIL